MNGGCYTNVLNLRVFKAGNFVSTRHILLVCEILEIRYFLPKLSCNVGSQNWSASLKTSIHHPTYHYVCLFVYPSLCPYITYICPSTHIFYILYTYTHLLVHPSIYHPFIYPSIYLFIHPTIQFIEPPFLLVCPFQVDVLQDFLFFGQIWLS